MSEDERRWQPLLTGEQAVRARDTVHDIVHALEQQPHSPEQGFKGDASLALVLALCDRSTAGARLESALNAVVSRPATIALFGGLCGASWTLGQVAQGDETEELVAHFEAAVLRYLDVPRWEERYDLMSGLAGVGVYAAGRRGGRAAQIAERVLSHLEATAIIDDSGATWRTPPQFLAEARRARFPAGVVDLGVAHGVPGIIGMLASFVEADIETDRSHQLLESAVRWLLSAVPSALPRFGTNWPADSEESKRMGWCYGDPGVAGVLLRASCALRSPELEREAIELLQQVIAPLASRGVPDACFCHGAAGLAHIYNVAFQRTGSSQMHAQAERWLAEVLRARKPRMGVAGYTFMKIDDDTRWTNDTTLLSGAAGVALVLLAAIEDRAPEWQTLFLL